MNTLDITDTPLPPGPAVRLFGMREMNDMRTDFLAVMQRWQRDHGDIVATSLYWEKVCAVFSPELLRELLVNNAQHLIRQERTIEVFSQIQGPSVMMTEGEQWQRQHRMLMPGFMPRRVAGYAGLMVDAAKRVLDGAVQGPAGSADLVNIQALTCRLTIDVILRTMFSTPAGEHTQPISAAVQALNEIAMRELFWPVTLPDWLPLPGKALKRSSMRLLDDFVDGHIRARKLMDPAQAPQDDLLAMLLAARDDAPAAAGHHALSDEELRAQCKVMFLAGHDTSATALTWWCWLMAENPQAVRRARDEIERVLGNRDPQPQDMPQLDWLVATIKEALRLYPPAPTLITRRTTADLRVGDALIPKRSMVWVVPWLTHRDPRWFPEPEAFKPERFTADAPPLPRGAWIPFGTGPRVCIGQHFAMLEMTLVAAMLLQRFDLAVDRSQPPVRPAFKVTLRPADAVHLRLTRRAPMR